jgi:hypothetical protein
MKESSIYEVLPYFNFEDEVMVMKDGRICVGYEVSGFEMEEYGEVELEEIRNVFNRFLQDLPDNSNIQKIDVYYEQERRFEIAMSENASLFIKENIDRFVQERKALEKRSYLFIELMPEKYNAPDPLRNFFVNQVIPKDRFKDLDVNKKRLRQIKRDFERWVVSYATVREMGKEQVYDLMWNILNLDFGEKKSYLESQIDNTQEEVMRIGNRSVSVISMLEQGAYNGAYSEREYVPKKEVKEPFSFDVGLGLQVPHLTVTNIRKKDRETGLGSFEREVMFTKNLPDMPAFKQAMERALEIEQVLEEVNKSKECIAELSLHCVVWGQDNEIENRVDDAKQAIKRLEGARPLEESKDKGSIFFSSLPGNGAMNFRRMVMPSRMAASYLDLSDNYVSDGSGDVMGDRFGNPLLFDNFTKELVAHNAIVIGPTGSGKSFSQGSLIAQSFQRGEINIIIDKGGTYKSLTETLGIVYFEHKEENPLRFNPFACERRNGKYWVTGEKVLMIRTLISLLWKNEDKNETFSTAESSVVMEMVPAYYDYCNDKGLIATLKGFVEFAELTKGEWTMQSSTKQKYFDVDHLKIVLEPYTSGMYAQILNAEDALDLSEHKNVCFDLEGVQKDPVLYPIITMMLIELILNHIVKFPDVLKNVYFDEAWSFMSGDMKDFIELMYRTIRKNNGKVVVITQSANDIESSEIGKAIVQNTNIFFVLNHAGKDTSPLSRVLSFAEHEVEKVESMRKSWETRRGWPGGRELFIKRTGLDAKVYSLEVPESIYPILTSMPKERNYLRKLLENHSVERAIYEFVQDKRAKVI